jgi:hypothetical protein
MYGRFFDMTIETNELPPIEILNDFIHLDIETGVAYWKPRELKYFNNNTPAQKSWNSRYATKKVGCIDSLGYTIIKIFDQRYKLHRIIFKMSNGYDPLLIDHINGDKSDNRPSNLRSVTASENSKNRCISSKNTSGFMGVTKRKNKFLGYVHGKEKYISQSFDTYEEASEYAINIRKEHGFHENHGRIKNENQK